MRKRKGRSSGTLVEERHGDGGDGGDGVLPEEAYEAAAASVGGGGGGKRVFGCYLLISLSPRHKGHTYIGFTVNPRRRIRQHNGDIRSGAWRTRSKRPWEMALYICGFPTHVAALQFEWAWQHPRESLAVREVTASFKSLSGLANKIKLAYTMLTRHTWQSMHLTINFFSTKYMALAAGCPSLPEQIKIQICTMDELPCYSGMDQSAAYDHEDDCNDSHGYVDVGSIIGSLRKDDLAETVERASMHVVNDNVKEASGLFHVQESSSCIHEVGNDFSLPLGGDQAQPCQVDFLDASISSFGSISRRTRISVAEHSNCSHGNQCAILVGGSTGGGWTQQSLEQSPPPLGVAGMWKSAPEDSNCSCENPCILVGESTANTQLSPEQSPPLGSGLAGIIQPCSGAGGEAEVIDLLTPSPACRTKLCSKKIRVPIFCADVIDLTSSPLFIRL
ncbi:hypothetical protein Dimus_009012 [Dionaea muscipula]